VKSRRSQRCHIAAACRQLGYEQSNLRGAQNSAGVDHSSRTKEINVSTCDRHVGTQKAAQKAAEAGLAGQWRLGRVGGLKPQCDRRLRRFSQSVDAFRFYRVAMDLPLAPVHASDPRKGIQEALDRFLTKFIPSLGFVLLTVNFESLTLLPVARLLDPTANMVCKVNFEGLGWRPAMGSTLRGRLMHSTRSHVSLILHNAFNASISSSHIPTDAYHWDPDMPNPNAGPETAMEDFYARKWREADEEQARFNGKTGLETEVRDLDLESVEPEGEIGCWVHTATGLPMGDGQGFVAFRVIGCVRLLPILSC
jgi:hypothetical protein